MDENNVSDKENNRPGTSTPERSMSIPAHSRSTNSFESRILETLHTNTFSPSVFAITETPPSPEEFKWSIEELSILKPVHITQEEIAQSSYSSVCLICTIIDFSAANYGNFSTMF
ncbi:hypothetical protein ANCCAN_21028 [Ancylostoma caninum]|uniref:Protein aurora borealis n=1 Tax=Ancylostoma caninum TaxID=29170 RepID=A0A368FM73_ANCCA|nr:hypothetical protein ANCCAN_21028 [Ancylostoma caninum]